MILPVLLVTLAVQIGAVWSFRYPLPPAPRTEMAPPPVLGIGALLRKYPNFAVLLLGCALMHGTHATCNTYMIHITAKVGAGESLIHVFSSGLGPAVMAVAGGWLMDRGGVNALLIFNTVSALVGAVIVTAATSHYFDKREARA